MSRRCSQLNLADRRRLFHFVESKLPIKEMARELGRQRSTINLDDTLMERAKSLTGTKEISTLVRQTFETLVRVESGKRLIALGGTMPNTEAAPRRRSAAAK